MVDFAGSQAEVLSGDRALLLVRWQNVMVQYRSGELTLSGLQHVASTARLVRTRVKGPVGLMAILAEGAPVSSAEVRKEQRKVIRDLLRDERSFVAVVTAGAGTGASLLSAAVRLIVPGMSRVRTVSDIGAACNWLAPRVGQPERDLLALAKHVEGLARV